jgi:hypothetical protein
VVPTKDLSVYDDQHPLPKDAVGAEKLRQTMTEASDKQIEALIPKDAKGLDEFRRVVGTALRTMVHDDLPKPEEVELIKESDREEKDGVILRRYLIGRTGAKEQIPALGMCRADFNGTVVVWIHPQGKASLYKDGKLVAAASQILDAKAGIFAPDVFGTGELASDMASAVDPKFAGFTFGYNRPLSAQRVHDILTTVAYVRGHEKTKAVDLVGWESAGPWVLLARGLCGDAVARTAADVNQFRFEKVRLTDDPMMLPGAQKYGGLGTLTALAAPGEAFVHNHKGTGLGKWTKAAYAAAGAADKFVTHGDKVEEEDVVKWLMR